MKNPPYTYRKRSGIYYFRLVKYLPELTPNIDIRFSLRTRVPYEAKVRAMSAWLHAQQLFMTGTQSSTDITIAVKSAIFDEESLFPQSCTGPCSGANPSHTHSTDCGRSEIGGDDQVMLVDEITAYKNRKTENGQWTDKTTMEYESILDTFVEIVGNKKVRMLNKGDVEKYVNVVNHLPPNRKKKVEYKGLSAKDVASKNRLNRGATLSPRQRKKYLTTVSPIFNEFVEEGLLGFNYFHRYRGKIRGVKSTISARNPFSSDDLRIMFESDKAIDLLATPLTRPSRAWGYLIALFTGARAEEIYSLSIQDIGTHDGTDYFNIAGNVKTEAAIRQIPIHPTLLELGLVDYLGRAKQAQKHRATPMLFPELNSNENHGYRRAPTNWFNNRFLPKLGLKTRKNNFHSNRHTTIDNLKRARKHIDSRKASQFIGHEDRRGPMWEHLYGSPFTPTELLEITEAIDYGLDFTELKERCLDRIIPRWHP